MKNRAFAVYHKSFECLAVYSAATRGKAIKAAYNAAQDAGYTTVKWIDFIARRAPKFDEQATEKGAYPIGYHARAYDLAGNFTGYDQFGCLAGLRCHPHQAYKTINAEAKS
ncbi:MAG: hypothetical protein DYG89_15130 [Caldilinea sp. CFX5]|nr:hypothetical protein [Caldilinea sp. CFX5]